MSLSRSVGPEPPTISSVGYGPAPSGRCSVPASSTPAPLTRRSRTGRVRPPGRCRSRRGPRPASRVPLRLLGHLVARVVRGAHERPRLDVLEAERQRLGLHLRELVGMDVALDRQVRRRRPQVLADGEDVAVDRAQVPERLAEAPRGSRRGRPSGSTWCGPCPVGPAISQRHRLGASQHLAASGGSGRACGPASGAARRSRRCG